jgi:acetate kinase
MTVLTVQQTIPSEARTYALPPSELENPMPLQKYGFHGLSYASIVDSVAKHLNKPADQVDIVVAHLGSGASAACIRGGKSIDTSESRHLTT